MADGKLSCVDQKQMLAPINCLIMMTPTVLLAGLDNGSVFAWDLTQNI